MLCERIGSVRSGPALICTRVERVICQHIPMSVAMLSVASMGGSRSYSDVQLATAVRSATSWRRVLRELGLAATSASALRSVRRRADDLGLDYSHFRGQRRWTDQDLTDAVSESAGWAEVADRLGLRGGSWAPTLKGHAIRLELSTDHLCPPRRPADSFRDLPAPEMLRRAAPMMAAAWFTLCRYDVSWPLEPCAYDLVVITGGAPQRIQVKSSTRKVGASWVAGIGQSGRASSPYDPDDVDAFFIVDGDLQFYLIPTQVVGGLTSVSLASYDQFKVAQRWSVSEEAS